MGPYGTAGQYLNSKLDLRCNIFNPGTNHWSGTDQIGLFIEPTVQLGDIGGPIIAGNSLSRPNSNIWPTAGARPSVKYTQDGVNGWSSPGDWVSIAFSGTTQKNYYRFNNEFVGTIYTPNVVDLFNTTLTECYMSDNIPNPILPNQIQVCSAIPSPGGIPYFPLRIGITGMDDQKKLSFNIYPQPCSDYLILEGTRIASHIGSVQIVTNLLGQTFEIQSEIEGDRVQLNTKDLPIGCYYLRTVGSSTIKFVKQ